MESVKQALAERIRAALPELALVAEEGGQLENGTELPPLPCVLIAGPKTEWTTQSNSRPLVQRGDAVVTLRLAVSGAAGEALASGEGLQERLLLAVQGFRPHARCSEMTRTQSNEYPLAGGVKVFETSFRYDERILFG